MKTGFYFAKDGRSSPAIPATFLVHAHRRPPAENNGEDTVAVKNTVGNSGFVMPYLDDHPDFADTEQLVKLPSAAGLVTLTPVTLNDQEKLSYRHPETDWDATTMGELEVILMRAFFFGYGHA